MSTPNENRNTELELTAPKELVEDLSALYAAKVPVPSEVDETIVSMARRRFARRRKPRPVLLWASAGAIATAAAVLLAVWIVGLPRQARADIDGNGRVDILDAFTLAGHVKAGVEMRDEWDINADGGVDWADVKVAALAAVVKDAKERQAREHIPAASVRFEAIDIYVDSRDEPLAAYQFEFSDRTDSTKIVGIEGGEHPAFKEPPYYDPKALSKGRIIIAAFNTGPDLPKGKTRVARLHVQIAGDQEPEYAVELTVAASLKGKRIPASVSISQGGEKR